MIAVHTFLEGSEFSANVVAECLLLRIRDWRELSVAWGRLDTR